MEPIRRRLRHMFWRTDPLPVEVASTLCAFAWFGLLACTSDPFSKPVYRCFVVNGTPGLWAVGFFLLGFSQACRIYFDCPRHLWVHRAVQLVATAAWSYASTAFFLTNPDSAACAAYVVFAVGNLWALVRSVKDLPFRHRG